MPKVKFSIRTAASGVLEGREEPALTTSKSPLSASVSGVGETKEVDQGPLSEARADPMILAVAGDVSCEPRPSHQSTNTNTTNKKSNKPSQHKRHKRHGESNSVCLSGFCLGFEIGGGGGGGGGGGSQCSCREWV